DDIAITHLTYGKDFARAIEEKQVAQQDAERQKFIVEKAEQERQATVIRSEGEAEAAKMISEALKEHGSGLIEVERADTAPTAEPPVRRIDTAKDIAENLAKSPNVMYLPNGQQMLLNLGSGARPQS
ncbi:unnamed protein product, partial [Durusdinium trenchii]